MKVRGFTKETKRNYATGIRLFLDFLWSRGRGWAEATTRDVEDYEHWRRQERANPQRVGGSKWVESGWASRQEDRNVAFVNVLRSSGLLRAECGSLLTFEVPGRRLDGGRSYVGKVAAGATRSKKVRTFYVASSAIGDVETYVDASRTLAIRGAQRKGRYERLPEVRIVTEVARGLKPMVHWVVCNGSPGRMLLNELTVEERMVLFTEGLRGLEPLSLWLNEQGLPFQPHLWEAAFRNANKRCERILTPPEHLRLDPHKVWAPYATPHSARHSFARYMLVVLNHLMDQKWGLTPEERRDFRLFYGDPWFMVQNLLGHPSREVTIRHYLAPVADLRLRSMLTTKDGGRRRRAAGGVTGCTASDKISR